MTAPDKSGPFAGDWAEAPRRTLAGDVRAVLAFTAQTGHLNPLETHQKEAKMVDFPATHPEPDEATCFRLAIELAEKREAQALEAEARWRRADACREAAMRILLARVAAGVWWPSPADAAAEAFALADAMMAAEDERFPK